MPGRVRIQHVLQSKVDSCRACLYILKTSKSEGLGQEDCEFKASLSYIAKLSLKKKNPFLSTQNVPCKSGVCLEIASLFSVLHLK